MLEQVAADIYRASIPVPFRGLRQINAYLLRGRDGWDLVDTGLATPAALAAWEAVWRALSIGPADLRQIIITHHHPDHMGMAGRFQQAAAEAGVTVPVRMAAREIEITDIVWNQREGRDAVLEAFFARCGVPDPGAVTFSGEELRRMKQTLLPFPTFEPLSMEAPVEIGARRFEPKQTPGHSDAHLMFFDPVDRLVLAGDHVLPHITPNIARWPGVVEDPLGRYLESLDMLAALPVARALPGHGDPFDGWVARLAALGTHHAERLAAMQAAVGKGATVHDITLRSFDEPTLDRHQFRLAIAETLAHLEHLERLGALRRHDAEAWRFEPA